MGEFDAYRLLYDLLNRNLIEEVRASTLIEPLGPSGLLDRLAHGGISLLLAALALASLLTLRFNPATPWRMEFASSATERLRTFASRARLERIEQAVRAFYLDSGAVPERLDALAASGYLEPRDLLDPWNRPYRYRLDSDAYRIAGLDGSGAECGDLSLRHPFSSAERLVLEGSAGAGTRRRGP